VAPHLAVISSAVIWCVVCDLSPVKPYPLLITYIWNDRRRHKRSVQRYEHSTVEIECTAGSKAVCSGSHSTQAVGCAVWRPSLLSYLRERFTESPKILHHFTALSYYCAGMGSLWVNRHTWPYCRAAMWFSLECSPPRNAIGRQSCVCKARCKMRRLFASSVRVPRSFGSIAASTPNLKAGMYSDRGRTVAVVSPWGETQPLGHWFWKCGLQRLLFRRVRTVAKSVCEVCRIRLSARLSTCVSAAVPEPSSVKFGTGNFYENLSRNSKFG
jgi:hypothetical protein